MGAKLEDIRVYVKEQYPDSHPENFSEVDLVKIELMREALDCYESTFGRMQDLTAALDRINTRLKDNLNALRLRKR